ncbi:MAG TPA: 4-hydroxy-tetrahydrodipicolinate reductase [Desulfotignum sp.]|nr:4-hydroxy-tetrahydrodipicolinate reductase [Desulfotignum sp.]
MLKKVCIAGATGWAGSALTKAVHEQTDMQVVGAVSRTRKGEKLSRVLGLEKTDVIITDSVSKVSLADARVLVEFTKPTMAMAHIITALDAGVHVVVGTSGLTDTEYAKIHEKALKKSLGVLAAGNFALTVVLLQKFSEITARYIPQWEIIDYAGDAKKDAPSGTARELAFRLSQIRASQLAVSLADTQGPIEARGANLSGSQVHSVRLPGFTLSSEIIFGLPDQTLSIRHDAGTSAQPYVDGALLAIRKVDTFTGLRRGLDQVMDLD